MKQPSSYLKLRVLGAIEYAKGKTIRDRIKNVSKQEFIDEQGMPRSFTWRTVSTWYYRYKKYGVTGLDAKPRSDIGDTRKMTPEELLEAINQVLPGFRTNHYTRLDLYRACIEKGILRKEQIAQTTFYRFIREYELLTKQDIPQNKRRLAFAMQYANQLWQADTLFGPYIKGYPGKNMQTKLIAFIDDASRVICHGEFFLSENIDNLISAFRSAIYKRGIPEQLYVDNGSIYSSLELKLVCDRIGCILRFTPVRDCAAKGKIERFFRTVRTKFLSRNLDLSGLSALNKQFNSWVEEQYNSYPHSALQMKPIDRFGIDLKRIHFLPPSKENDELFYAEESRTVKKDNTFPFKKTRYEAPVDLRNKKIQIRFDRKNQENIIVYYKNQRLGQARVLDLIANAYLRSTTQPRR
jgi:putative transposase